MSKDKDDDIITVDGTTITIDLSETYGATTTYWPDQYSADATYTVSLDDYEINCDFDAGGTVYISDDAAQNIVDMSDYITYGSDIMLSELNQANDLVLSTELLLEEHQKMLDDLKEKVEYLMENATKK